MYVCMFINIYKYFTLHQFIGKIFFFVKDIELFIFFTTAKKGLKQLVKVIL